MNFSELSQTYGIAITGGIASGKSTVAESLRQRGFVVIDADQVSRLVVKPGTEGLKEIVLAFGPGILTESGEMDRAKMRDIVFQSLEKRLLLEKIIHTRLQSETHRLLETKGVTQNPKPWFYEASLIYERERAKDFSQVWVAFCPRELQIERVMARDQITHAQAEAILASQLDPKEKARRADHVIDTDCPRNQIEERIDQALATLPPDMIGDTHE